MRILYAISIRAYRLLISLAALRNEKARLWIHGRRNWRENLRKSGLSEGPVVWMHCASLGEFEQGRPVFEALKEKMPDRKFLLTFYSPSGYEIRKDYKGADYVSYLPLDTASNARDFVSIVNPEVVLFVKYEFWPHFFNAIGKSPARLHMVSAIFRPGQRFFKWYGAWFRKILQQVDHFFLQDIRSRDLLTHIGLSDVSISGDTRFDRVMSLKANAQPLPMIERFKGDHKLLILGSSWPGDEKLLAGCKQISECKVIIAPHEISESRMSELENLFPEMLRYSKCSLADVEAPQVLVIDNIGMLSKLYQHADIAMIGGGFGRGVHNTLEAAVWGIPLIVGPNNEKFAEIQDMKSNGAILEVQDQSSFDAAVKSFLSQEGQVAGQSAAKYVSQKAGATRQIAEFLVG